MKTNSLKLVLLTAFTMLGTFTQAFSQEAKWLSDYTKAVQQAKAEHKALLLNFTGSDWCGWCIKMKKDVLDTKEFSEYAAKNLILVEVDFPHSKPLTDEVKKQNGELKDRFSVHGYPTFVLLSDDEKKLGEQVGYSKGGPEPFIEKLKGFAK